MKSKRTLRRAVATVAIAAFAAPPPGWILEASAQTLNPARYTRSVSANAPVLAIVGLSEQRVSIYDATGKVLEAPVSSGATGYETPPGIYSVVQKEEEHYSSLYDDASMPFMQRITWTGIALHAGELPGRPASHGCVRMPHAFAQQLYEITKLGMRVIVMREDITPASVAQPALFERRATSKDRAEDVRGGVTSAIRVAGARTDSRVANHLQQLQSIARAKTAEAEAAARREKDLRQAAAKMAASAAEAVRSLRGLEINLAKAQAELKDAERALEKNSSSGKTAKAETAETRARAKVEAAQAQIETSKPDVQSKMDAAARAKKEAEAAAEAMNTAEEAAQEANQDLSPVSVLISRKTQRLYIRKANQPVFEAPVLIRDADKPIGTFIYTALDYAGTSDGMRWNVVSMYKNPTNIEPYAQVKPSPTAKGRRTEPAVADVTAAQAALDRLGVPQEAADRMSETVLPGSSLIISDEGPSIETGKDTDFVVLMSGEPQGGMTIRRRRDTNSWARRDGYEEDAFWRPSRGRRSSGGGFPFFSDW